MYILRRSPGASAGAVPGPDAPGRGASPSAGIPRDQTVQKEALDRSGFRRRSVGDCRRGPGGPVFQPPPGEGPGGRQSHGSALDSGAGAPGKRRSRLAVHGRPERGGRIYHPGHCRAAAAPGPGVPHLRRRLRRHPEAHCRGLGLRCGGSRGDPGPAVSHAGGCFGLCPPAVAGAGVLRHGGGAGRRRQRVGRRGAAFAGLLCPARPGARRRRPSAGAI